MIFFMSLKQAKRDEGFGRIGILLNRKILFA